MKSEAEKFEIAKEQVLKRREHMKEEEEKLKEEVNKLNSQVEAQKQKHGKRYAFNAFFRDQNGWVYRN